MTQRLERKSSSVCSSLLASLQESGGTELGRPPDYQPLQRVYRRGGVQNNEHISNEVEVEVEIKDQI